MWVFKESAFLGGRSPRDDHEVFRWLSMS